MLDMKSRYIVFPFVLALAGAGCMSASPAPVASNTPPAAVEPTAPPKTNVEADTGIAIKKYTDDANGFTVSYPAEWKLDETTGDLKFTNLGPDGGDFITIKRVIGASVTDRDSKFGDTTLRFDDKSQQWMVKAPDENEDYVEKARTPDMMTDTGLPVFGSTGRWATYIVALSHTKFLVVNISGSGWTNGIQPFVKTISLIGTAPKPEQITADMKAIIDSEKQP